MPVRVTVVRLSVCVCPSLTSHVWRSVVLKTLSHTQWVPKVKMTGGISLKPLRCRDPALPTLCTAILCWPFFTTRKNAHAHLSSMCLTGAHLLVGGLALRGYIMHAPRVCTLVLFINFFTSTLAPPKIFQWGSSPSLEKSLVTWVLLE